MYSKVIELIVDFAVLVNLRVYATPKLTPAGLVVRDAEFPENS